MYKESDPYRFSSNYFNEYEKAMADTGFQGDGKNIIFAIKKNQSGSYEYRSSMNADIQRQIICNELSIGLVSNNFCMFLCHWTLEETIFPAFHRAFVHVVNFLMQHGGVFPAPLERMFDRMELYERDELKDWAEERRG